MSTALGEGVCPLLGPCPTGGTEILDPSTEVKLKGMPRRDQAKLVVGTNFVSLKKTKHFDDGPLLPLSPSQGQGEVLNGLKTPNLSVTKKGLTPLLSHYVPGQVRQTQNQALEKLADEVDSLPPGTTGAIVEEGFEPAGEQYTEGIHYLMEKKVSNGSFGSGDMCIDTGSVLNTKRFFRKTMVKENFRSAEVIVPINLNHKNVTKLYGMIYRQEENSNSIVELMMEPAGTALNTFIQREKVDTPGIWNITKQIMAGLNHMHYYGMIHFDMKPENVCIKVDGSGITVKITDFGSAKLPKDQIMFVGWTPEYMCRETSLLFLQNNMSGTETMVTEDEVTGKVDVFAGALIVMYMYTNVHVLQRLITKGKSSYSGYTDEERKNLQIELLRMLAFDPNVVPLVVPDVCDLDMRELLGNMTQFNHENRFTAQDVINFIEKRDKRLQEAIQACQRKELLKKIEREGIREASVNLDPYMVTDIPEIAFNCMDKETGPIKLATKHRLQEKLRPYNGKGKGKMMYAPETPLQEMQRLEVANRMTATEVLQNKLASKKFVEYPEPPTPVTDVSLSMARLNMEKPVCQTERCSIVAQPMNDDNAQSPYIYNRRSFQSVSDDVIQSAMSNTAPINSKVLPPAPIPDPQLAPQGQTANNGAAHTPQNNTVLLALMQIMINKGLVGVKTTEKGPQLINLPQPRVANISQHSGVRSGPTPFPPITPQQANIEEDQEPGNIPDFLKLG